jgi:hypothetical protein
MRGQSSNSVTGAQAAVGTSCVSGVQIGQHARALCSCDTVGFSPVSRLPMPGQSSNSVNAAQGAVGTSCVSGVQIGQKARALCSRGCVVFRLYIAFQCAARAQAR